MTRTYTDDEFHALQDEGGRLAAGYQAIGLDPVEALVVATAAVACLLRRQYIGPGATDAKALAYARRVTKLSMSRFPRSELARRVEQARRSPAART